MGAALSCFQANDRDDDRRCNCFNFAVDPISRVWSALSQGMHNPRRLVAPEPPVDDTSWDTFSPPPRPLSFDDPRCSYIYSSGLSSPSDKASSHISCTTELNINNGESYAEALTTGNECKHPKDLDSLLLKQAPREQDYGLLYAFAFPEEDTCPICLEEYILENPEMTLRCMHHFHLSCIYEWMERSETCPICGKLMEFQEKA